MKPRYTSIIDGKPVFNEGIIGLINRAKQRPNIPAYARLLQLYNQIMGINWGTVTVTIGRKKLNSGIHTQLRLDFDAAVDNARRHEAGMRRARIEHSEELTHMSDDELEHFGIQGQRWGVRRFQNEDGTLTEAGRRRYGVLTERYNKAARSAQSTYARATDMVSKANARVSRADAKIHKFNARLGYEAPHADKNPLKNNQNQGSKQPQGNIPKPQGEPKPTPQPQPQQPQQPQQPPQPKPIPQPQQPQQPKPQPQQPQQPQQRSSINEISPNYWMKPINQMNDAELKAYADRLVNQQKIQSVLKPATPVNSKEVQKQADKGESYVTKQVKTFGDKAVSTVVNGAASRVGNAVLDAVWDKFTKKKN